MTTPRNDNDEPGAVPTALARAFSNPGAEKFNIRPLPANVTHMLLQIFPQADPTP